MAGVIKSCTLNQKTWDDIIKEFPSFEAEKKDDDKKEKQDS